MSVTEAPSSSAAESGRLRPLSAADVQAMINRAIADQHGFVRDILSELVAEMRAAAADDMADSLKSLACEIVDLRATVAELRLALCDVRSKEPLQLPDAFRTGKKN